MKTKDNSKGILGTIIFHGLLLICFILWGFHSPLPPPPEEGIEINLGYSNDGMGDIQPDDPATDNSSPATSNSNDEVASQNSEESANLAQKNQDSQTNDKQEDPVNQNAIYKGKNKNQGGNEGETGKPGDQGDPNGDPNSKNHYGTPGSGGGVSFSLNGRQKKSLPKPDYNSREEGIVVVSIWVDKQGNVTKVIAGARGTTTSNQTLWKLAEDAARKAKFDTNANAPEEQKGTITYNFINLN